jgi:cholinesterase
MFSDCPFSPFGNQTLDPILNQLVLPQALTILEELAQTNNTASEDCLGLNIWTKPQTGSANKGKLAFSLP